MPAAAIIVAVLGCALYLASILADFLNAVKAARRSNLPYHFVLVPNFNRCVELFRIFWEPPLRFLPASWKRGRWYRMKAFGRLWNLNYNLFRMYDADSFLTVTPTGVTEFYTGDADVISQVVARKNDFPKALWMYSVLDLYGKNVVSTEGDEGRRHRKAVGTPFTEKNNDIVWSEAIRQTQAMIDSMLAGGTDSTPTIDNIDPYMSTLALAVFSKAAYGASLGWKQETGRTVYHDNHADDTAASDASLGRDWLEGKTHGHTMPFGDCLYSLSKNLLWNILLPERILSWLPIDGARNALAAYRNWGGYMREMLAWKRETVAPRNAEAGKSQDLLSILMRTMKQKRPPNDTRSGKIASRDKEEGYHGDERQQNTAHLSDEEILGNIFALMVAGHETTAGSLMQLLVMLAVDIPAQRRLQADIDAAIKATSKKPEGIEGQSIQSSPPRWDYERLFPRLLAGLPGAALAEELRLIGAVFAPPKWSPKAQTITVNGKACTLPAGTEICLNILSVHRNPRFWQHGRRDLDRLEYCGVWGSDPTTDLGEFKPERWLPADYKPGDSCVEKKAKEEDIGNIQDGEFASSSSTDLPDDNAAGFLRPPRGAYLPFSEGSRSCIGRRFAQVEIMAILATLLSEWSIELAVDTWATDDQVAAMDDAERREVWDKARNRVRESFTNSLDIRISPKVHADIPIRLVRRGKERFPHVAG